MLVASFVPAIGRFFVSLDNRISPIGTAAIALAVAALLVYVVLWVVGRFRRPSLAALLEPYRMTTVAGESVPGPSPIITSFAGLFSRTSANISTTSVMRLTGRKFERCIRIGSP